MSDFHVIIRGDSMWPTFSDGEKVKASELSEEELTIGDIVVCKHPFKSKVIIVKRINQILANNQLFLQGDNPDPLSSEDSHNFGPVNVNLIIGIIKN
ncbi:MAG: nickel-type superoxide dismutase maturation protease [Euryarchaeota archaeon]|jgi:nickel-type superoxide dismutase maturation protease|nr:nickel-type superoxide dismutase maturation protease [Euryarchaeota archaeon]MBT5254514.1 nickel-type superoxide dismutase maturation protease [Euryarchaeota archaeon]